MLKALTIWQPYAQAIFTHGKTVENRSKPTSHRGWLAIHAGKQLDRQFWQNPGYKESIEKRDCQVFTHFEQFVHGAILGVVRLHDVVRNDSSAWARAGQWHWQLRDAQLFAEPIKTRGALGLWSLDDETMARVAAMMLASQ